MFSGRIQNCYDSHCHWLGTGEFLSHLSLTDLTAPRQIFGKQPQPENYFGEWLLGFGWDDNKFSSKEGFHRSTLDQLFPNTPVSFIRADGHVTWVNTEALKRIGWFSSEENFLNNLPELQGGVIEVDSQGVPTGILIDAAKSLVDRLIPKPDAKKVREFLLKGAHEFLNAGFTHVRDMSCSEMQWEQSLALEESGELTFCVEQTFSAEVPDQFDAAIALAKRALKANSKFIRPNAMKTYYDGALGSEGAWISKPYGGDGENFGFTMMPIDELKGQIRRAWELSLGIAIHTIGDQAVHDVSQAAVELWDSGLTGKIHLEHAELMRPETAKLLKGRDVICHIQPCHWLSDQRWLELKLPELKQFAFPWALLQENDIAFDFGSDSPVEPPSLINNIRAVNESAVKGVPKLKGETIDFHSHPATDWPRDTYSVFENGNVKEVVFQGKTIRKL